jgi:hypothetical protein
MQAINYEQSRALHKAVMLRCRSFVFRSSDIIFNLDWKFHTRTIGFFHPAVVGTRHVWLVRLSFFREWVWVTDLRQRTNMLTSSVFHWERACHGNDIGPSHTCLRRATTGKV